MSIKFIILFVFIFALLSFNIPQNNKCNNIKIKLYIFCGIFLFELFSNIFIKVYQQKIIDSAEITKNSLQSGLVAIVAYSIYTDLIYSQDNLANKIDTPVKKNLAISGIIMFGIGINYFAERFFSKLSPKINDQLNIIYPKK